MIAAAARATEQNGYGQALFAMYAIRAACTTLLAKTVENGCTEQEALEAAAKAKDLMDRYEIELTNEQIVEDGAVREFWAPKTMYEAQVARYAGVALSVFTETKVYWNNSTATYRAKVKPLAIIGLRSDVEFTLYLLKSLAAFGLAGAMMQPGRDRTRYMTGYASRLAARLREMIAARKKAREGEGRALVVVDLKKKAIADFIAADRLKLGSGGRTVIRGSDSSAYAAGAARGDAAAFGRPVGSGTVAMIGYRN